MAFQSNLSASDLWNPAISIENRILVLIKFVSHSVQKMIQTATNILRNGEWQIVCKIVVNLLFSRSYQNLFLVFSCIVGAFGKFHKTEFISVVGIRR